MHPASSLAGQELAGRYAIAERIGAGGMATVYRATDKTTGAEVAVKMLDPGLAFLDPDVVRRFKHEAQAAARIEHPNAVHIFDFGMEGDKAWIVMELVTGRDLGALVAEEAPLDVWRAADLVAQICDVLSAAHHEGILHRDLKPDNVVVLGLPPAEHIKVLDFGLAKVFAQRPGALEFTGTAIANSVVGTPEYMSPEQCRGDKLDQRSDIYSVGVLFYQMITGRVPFLGASNIDTMLRQVKDPPYSPSLIVPRIPESVEKAVLKALAKEPKARYQTARHFQEALIKLGFEAGL
jgi:eukaryotic-like serine/threonine-protein kinase